MKNDLKITRLFLNGILFSSVLFSPAVLDLTLVTRFIALSVFILASFYFLYSDKHSLEIKPDSILLLYSAYVLFCIASFGWSHNKSESLFEISKLILSFSGFLFTFYCLKKQNSLFTEWLLKLSVILAGLALIAGYSQFAGIDRLTKESLYEITGLNGHKNLYASFLFLNLFFLINAARKLKGVWKKAAVVFVFLNILVILLLRTKAVWLGLAVAALVYFIFYFAQRKESRLKINVYVSLGCLLIMANVLFLGILKPVINKLILSEQTTITPKSTMASEQERLILWSKTYSIIDKHKAFGVGMGNWQINFPDATLRGLYRAEVLNYTFQRPHNDFLWILSETGIIGLNLFLLFLFTLFLFLLKAIKQVAGNKLLYMDLLLVAAFISGYFTISFFDFPKERIEHGLWINILLGFAYYYIKNYVPLLSLKGLMLQKTMFRLVFAVLGFILITGLLRYKGEYYTRKMYDAKNSNNVPEIIKTGRAAWSVFYTLDPTSVPINWYLANACASMGNYIDAHSYFLKAYHENPYNRNVLNDLASSYIFNQNTALAKKYYEEAARISPRFDDPKLNLAAVYIKEKDFKKAGACLDSIFHDSKRRENYRKIVEINQPHPQH